MALVGPPEDKLKSIGTDWYEDENFKPERVVLQHLVLFEISAHAPSLVVCQCMAVFLHVTCVSVMGAYITLDGPGTAC